MSLPKLSPSCRPKVRSDLQSCSSEALENRGVETKTRKKKKNNTQGATKTRGNPRCYKNQGGKGKTSRFNQKPREDQAPGDPFDLKTGLVVQVLVAVVFQQPGLRLNKASGFKEPPAKPKLAIKVDGPEMDIRLRSPGVHMATLEIKNMQNKPPLKPQGL